MLRPSLVQCPLLCSAQTCLLLTKESGYHTAQFACVEASGPSVHNTVSSPLDQCSDVYGDWVPNLQLPVLLEASLLVNIVTLFIYLLKSEFAQRHIYQYPSQNAQVLRNLHLTHTFHLLLLGTNFTIFFDLKAPIPNPSPIFIPSPSRRRTVALPSQGHNSLRYPSEL